MFPEEFGHLGEAEAAGDADYVWFHRLADHQAIPHSDTWELTRPDMYDLEEDDNSDTGSVPGTYVKVYRGRIDPAHLRLLHEGHFPDHHEAAAPKYDEPVGSHGFRYIDENVTDIPDYINVGHLRAADVPISDITVAGQPYLNRAKVEEYARQPPEHHGRKPKVILRPYGESDIAVVDGHHTIAGRRLRGDTHVRALWLDDDPTDGMYEGWNARKASSRPGRGAAKARKPARPRPGQQVPSRARGRGQ